MSNNLAKWTFSEHTELPIKLVKVTDQETLYRHWPWIEARMNVVKKKDRGHEHWTPAHVRQAILNGFRGASAVELWLGVNSESEIEGFVVTTVRGDPFIQLPVSLVAWILWANESLMWKTLSQIEEIARSRYLPAIEFISSRAGWIPKAAKFGFHVSVYNFRKELS